MTDIWKTVSGPSTGLYKEKGSRFIAYLFPVKDEEEIKQLYSKVKKEHHSARHHCYAWRLGTEDFRTRCSDDGEPSSTAGKPVLGQITSNELTNVLIIVVRYFGGILLGTSGLIHAYRSAAADAIGKSKVVQHETECGFIVVCSFHEQNQVYQIVHQEGYRMVRSELSERCTLTLAVGKSESARAAGLLGSIPGITVSKTVLIND